MNGKASVVRIYAGREPRLGLRRGCGHLFGPAAERMNPKAQIFAALSGVLLVAFAPGLWWLFTTYFWLALPAFGLLARGLAGVSERRTEIASARSSKERATRSTAAGG